MQTQPLTWQAVVLQLLLSLGPAVIALTATYITLRHQRKTKRDELSLSSSLRARELVFNHYQKKLDRISALSENLSKAYGELDAIQRSLGKADLSLAFTNYVQTVTEIVLMAKHEAEGIEDELRAYGLENKYEHELGVVRQVISNKWQPQGEQQQQFENYCNMLRCFTLVQEAALEARMRDLFSEYLPARRALKHNS